MSNFKPVSNGFSFACSASYNIEGASSDSQRIQAEHTDLIGDKVREANDNMVSADNTVMADMPDGSDNNKMTAWQTRYNLVNTTGQLYVNELQTETQNDGTQLQSIGNFINNLIQIQSAIVSPLNTVTTLLQSSL